ncbi:MAG: Basal-body rod modification protein FlgD [Clostridium sp.]|jgi:flagellar basal-body rod modification protein FlgD
MDNLGVTGYGVLGQTYASATNSASSAAQSSDATLGMNDFLMLLAAQFQNQDVMNPTDNTEFISELAQFSALQAMSELTQYSQRQYASSLVGKTVVVGGYDQTGAYVTKQGVVQSATFSSDKCSIIVDDSAYDLSSVVQVVQDSSALQDSSDGDDAVSA